MKEIIIDENIKSFTRFKKLEQDKSYLIIIQHKGYVRIVIGKYNGVIINRNNVDDVVTRFEFTISGSGSVFQFTEIDLLESVYDL